MEGFIAIGSLLLSVFAGGIFVTYLRQSNKAQVIKLLLSFSGGFLLAIAFMHFIPDLYLHNNNNIGLYILTGFLIQLVMEYFSGGIEHGHVHVHKGQKMPWALFISLSVHSVLEGIPLGNLATGYDHELIASHHDHSLLLGILFHQVPVSIALMTLLINTNLSTAKAWIVLMLFGIMTPLGVVIGLFTPSSETGLDFSIILAIVVGMFLHISTTIIFEISENHKFNLLKLASIFVGVGLALLM